MPRMAMYIRLARWMAPLSLSLLLACAGSASVSGPASQEVTSGGTSVGGVPDAGPSGLTGPGPGPGPAVAAAQSLPAGFPAPVADPNAKYFNLDLLEELPVCRLVDKNLVLFKLNGFVHLSDPNNLNIPESLVEFLAQGSLRVVDLNSSKFTDVPFSSKQSVDEYGVQFHKIGYFEFNVEGAYQYHLRFFVLPPKGGAPVSTPWSPCPDTACAPEPIPDVVPNVIAKTPSGDLETSFAADIAVPICKVGRGNFDLPIFNWN